MFFSFTKEKNKLQIELIERKEVELGMTKGLPVWVGNSIEIQRHALHKERN
jgi:hypothetical protein